MNANAWRFAAVFVVVNLHPLRNLSLPIYLVVYAIVVLPTLVLFVQQVATVHTRKDRWGPFLIWVAVTVVGFVVSLATISPAGAITGMGRMLFAVPVFIALYVYTDSFDTLRTHVRTYVVFFALASLTLPLQFFTGPISWFADNTERAGIDRYSSLVGSLTALGIVVGCYIVLAHAMPGLWGTLWIAAMALSAAVSLSKAAIANVCIAILVLLWMNRRAVSRYVAGLLLVAAAAGTLYAWFPPVTQRIDAVLLSFGLENSSVVNYDATLVGSVIDRVVELPLENFRALESLGSPFVYLVGGGFGMADTALVPEADSIAPMAHNQYAELITVFGVFGGLLVIGSLFVVLRRIHRLGVTGADAVPVRAVKWAFVVLLVNSVFANGTLYQPAAASVYLLALFLAVAGGSLAGRAPGSQSLRTHPLRRRPIS